MKRGRPPLGWNEKIERWVSIEIERRLHWPKPRPTCNNATASLLGKYGQLGLSGVSSRQLRQVHAEVERRRSQDALFRAQTNKKLAERMGVGPHITFRVTRPKR